MGKWMDLKGPVVADTVYSDNTLVAKDVSFTLPGLEFMTADVMAMGNMTVPLVGPSGKHGAHNHQDRCGHGPQPSGASGKAEP